MTEVLISARPVHPAGGRMGYGLWWGTAREAATGRELVVGGLGEERARANAERTAAREWGEVLVLLEEEERLAEALEAGEVEWRE